MFKLECRSKLFNFNYIMWLSWYKASTNTLFWCCPTDIIDYNFINTCQVSLITLHFDVTLLTISSFATTTTLNYVEYLSAVKGVVHFKKKRSVSSLT